MKKLKITYGGYYVYAKLYYDKVPKLIAALEKASPIIGLVRHARVCENEWMVMTPAIDVPEETPNIKDPVAGTFGFHRPGPHICGWYAPMKPIGPTNVFAQVETEDLPEYERQMRKVWLNPGGKIKVEIVEVIE
jgi:hypothetical protein